MSYSPTTWASGGAPGIDAAKLNNLESQYAAVKSELGNNAGELWTAIKSADGSGSGLDADLLDGYHASYFAKSDLLNSKDIQPVPTGRTKIDSGAYTYTSYNDANAPVPYGEVVSFGKNGQSEIIVSWNGNPQMFVRSLRDTTDNWTNWYKVWSETNDGAGSGLDADLLDGLQGNQFVRNDVDNDINCFLRMNDTTSEKRILSNATNAGFYFNSTGVGMYDWGQSNDIYKYDKISKEFRILSKAVFDGSAIFNGPAQIGGKDIYTKGGNITWGTASPSGGSNGDIYIQY